MTCRQLGGACDVSFTAESFEEMADLSRTHGMEMFQKGDEAHLKAMDEMSTLMQDPAAMEKWFREKQEAFEALPND